MQRNSAKNIQGALTAPVCSLFCRKSIALQHTLTLVALKMYEMLNKCPGKQMLQHYRTYKI